MLRCTKEVLEGRRLAADDSLDELIHGDLKELMEGADRIRKKYCGDAADLCSIVNGRGGRCSEDCRFCAQSAHHHTDCQEYGIPDPDTFLADCGRVSANEVNRYSMVTAGRTLEGEDLEKALSAYKALHRQFPDMTLCASHGLMEEVDLRKLKKAGVSVYHANLETSERFFPQICTTHTFQDKLEEIRRAKAAGLDVCSGGIFGMGESWQDRLDMALLLSALQIRSIPMNFLIPIPGTPLGDQKRLETDEILRIVAIFRHINPTAWIRIAAGRNYFSDGGAALFKAGANATITGDMLTTVGNNTAQDRTMLKDMGFALKKSSREDLSHPALTQAAFAVRQNTSSRSPVHQRKAQKSSVRSMTMVALMTAVLCILAPLAIPIGPVPISLTNLTIYFALYLLGTKKGTASYVLYILLGLAGLPVFSGFQGGPGKLFGLTGGYIFGFIFMALIAGSVIDLFPEKRWLHVIAMILGTAVCYLFGTAWFVFLAKCGIGYALAVCVLPFIPGDLVKIGLAAAIAPVIRRRLVAAGLCSKYG